MKLYDWEKIKPQQVTELYSRKIAAGDNVSVARLEVKAGAATRMHHHDVEEVIVVLKGVWQFFLPTGEVTLKANQMMTIPAGMSHGSRVLEDVVAIDICSRRARTGQAWRTSFCTTIRTSRCGRCDYRVIA